MPTTTYAHFSDVPESAWRWPSFSPAEIACRGTGAIKINTDAMDKLQSLRNRLGKPLIVRSAYRSPRHNRAVGGAKASKHTDGIAFDIAMSNHNPAAFTEAARAVGFLGFGTYPRSGFMHIDLGPARQWGEAFAMRASAFAVEVPPAREVLAESRTLRGTGTAGVEPSAQQVWKWRRTFWQKPNPPSCRLCPISTLCAGCLSRWRSRGLLLRFGRGSMTGARARDDVGHHSGRDPRPALGALGGGGGACRSHRRAAYPQHSPCGRARWARSRTATKPGATSCYSTANAGGRCPAPS